MNDGDPIKNDNFCDTFEVIKDIASRQGVVEANNLVFLVGNKTSLSVFATRELADRFVSNFGGATAGGMTITSVPVIGAVRNNAETLPLDWRNALTANLLIYGCGLTKTQIRAIISFVIDGVEPPADLFATKSTSDMLDDRAEFEAYMSTQGWSESDLSDKCSRTGEYHSPRLRDDWKIWQARAAIASRQPTLSRSQKLAAAGFTARDTRIACDECGNKYTPQMLPVHKCIRNTLDTLVSDDSDQHEQALVDLLADAATVDNPDALNRVLQLTGKQPCPKCNYVIDKCRCEKTRDKPIMATK